MALFLTDSPYDLTPRGQKLIYRVISTNITQDGFKYGVKVTDTFTSQEFNFFYTPDFTDGSLYFDLSPLVNLRNNEAPNDLHSGALSSPNTVYREGSGNGWRTYTVNVTEWWLVGNVLTKNLGVGFTETTSVFNAYYQPSNGYKPDVNSGIPDVSFSLEGSTNYAWSDRKDSTYKWPLASTYTPLIEPIAVYIPAFLDDYGMIMCCPKNNLLTANDAVGFAVEFYTGDDPTPLTQIEPLDAVSQMEGVRIYPGNLQYNTLGLPQPSAYPNWTHYVFYFTNSSDAQCSRPYVFFNADKFGLGDCRFNTVRLAWVGSRGGWDYQNFTKKNEDSYAIERRQFRQILPNFFNSAVRQLTDRQNIVDKVITVNSDWLQEGEFEFLKGLLVSNQVHIVNADGSQTPVSVAESTYIARRERTGKKYNLTLKIAYSQDYWS
jgi:hypothetical protein